jgi:hypothetical protein
MKTNKLNDFFGLSLSFLVLFFQNFLDFLKKLIKPTNFQ